MRVDHAKQLTNYFSPRIFLPSRYDIFIVFLNERIFPPPLPLISYFPSVENYGRKFRRKKKKKKRKIFGKKKRKRKGRENLFAGSICNFKPPRAFYRQESGNYFGGERGPDVVEIWKRLRIPAKSTLHDYGSLSRIPNKDSGRLKGAD